MRFVNLDDVEKYVNEHLEGWKIRRGKQTFLNKEELTPTEDYEVIQLFRPGDDMIPYAELWRGYYDFVPEECKGFYGPTKFRSFSCSGSINFAMREVQKEHERIVICPRIIKAVEAAAKKDEKLKEVYRPISRDDISKISASKWWAVECDNFSCGVNQRCVLSVSKENDTFYVKYSLQTWVNDDHYENDFSNVIDIAL